MAASINTVLGKRKVQQNGFPLELELDAECVQVAMDWSKEREMVFVDSDRDHVLGQVYVKSVKELLLTAIPSLVVVVRLTFKGKICFVLMIAVEFELAIPSTAALRNLLALL